ncbi:MAG: hypothetical protein QOI41_6006, partial [Myxococcales bacterium]|nr:hypothetical protein [Myxococcales bacterium]
MALGICAAVGCGLDLTGSLDSVAAPGVDAGAEGSATLPDLDASGDAAGEAGTVDADVDTGTLDAESMRPDAGVAFAPSHIQPV